jgi:uncharacterized lipoprotein YddW (UPF0748 family)
LRIACCVLRVAYGVIRSTVVITALAVITTACVPVVDPTPAPRVIFPTDDRPPPTAQPPTPQPSPTLTPRPTPAADPLTEYRALWVDGSNDGLKTPTQVSQLIRDCQSISCNVLLVQVRIHANALHLQSSEPRVDTIAPGFDPLTDVISKAHSVSPPIEVYAWVNALPVWPADMDPPSDPRHIFNTHGPQANGADNWLALNEQGNLSGTGLYYLDPGHPEAATHVVRQVVSVVENYAVDGVHLDFIRYGGIQWGYNPASVARFNARYNRSGTPPSDNAQWSQWRRDQVTAVVRRIWLESTAVNPRIKVSAALIPWGDAPANDLDWQNSAAYRTVFQDWRAWLQEGILDIAFPMNYFSESSTAANLDHWIEFERSHRYNRHVVIGLGSYMNTLEETLSQIRRARGRSNSSARADGVAIYVYNQTNKDRQPFWQFTEATTLGLVPSPAVPVFAPRAYLPPMPWKSAPVTGHLMGLVTTSGQPADGAAVTLTGPARRTTTTDGSGFYGLVDLPPGAYRITTGNATITTTIRAGSVVTANLNMP